MPAALSPGATAIKEMLALAGTFPSFLVIPAPLLPPPTPGCQGKVPVHCVNSVKQEYDFSMLKAEAKKKEKAVPCLDMKGSLYLVSSSPHVCKNASKPGTACKKRGGQQAKWPSHGAGVRYKTGVWNLCHPVLS